MPDNSANSELLLTPPTRFHLENKSTSLQTFKHASFEGLHLQCQQGFKKKAKTQNPWKSYFKVLTWPHISMILSRGCCNLSDAARRASIARRLSVGLSKLYLLSASTFWSSSCKSWSVSWTIGEAVEDGWARTLGDEVGDWSGDVDVVWDCCPS